jgi:hypothetical protein
MTCKKIEERMDELGCRLVETHDKKTIKELYELALELEKADKQAD